MGRQGTFGRTQSMPAVQFGQSGGFGFVTHSQAMAQAQGIISREDLRRRELKPYSSADSDDIRALALANREGSPEKGRRRLTFGADGSVSMEGESVLGSAAAPDFGMPMQMVQGRKRGKAEADADGGEGDEAAQDDDEEKTEVDEEEFASRAEGFSGSGSTLVDEFPPVFASPAITHPELFDSPAGSPLPSAAGAGTGGAGGFGLMLPPPVPPAGARKVHRPFANRSGRMLTKTVSAPVHMLNTNALNGGMEVDDALPDGFDVAEWAKAEPK
jgi:hypothetical protein